MIEKEIFEPKKEPGSFLKAKGHTYVHPFVVLKINYTNIL